MNNKVESIRVRDLKAWICAPEPQFLLSRNLKDTSLAYCWYHTVPSQGEDLTRMPWKAPHTGNVTGEEGMQKRAKEKKWHIWWYPDIIKVYIINRKKCWGKVVYLNHIPKWRKWWTLSPFSLKWSYYMTMKIPGRGSFGVLVFKCWCVFFSSEGTFGLWRTCIS